MSRILAIDYGLKRIGLAVTDKLKIIASPLETIPNNQLFEFIEKYTQTETIETIVIGIPLTLKGTNNDIVKNIEKVITKLNTIYPKLPVKRIDERFTSKIASNTIAISGLKKKKRQDKSLIDKISATIILQSYLEQNSKF